MISLADSSGRTALSRLAITFFVSPFIAVTIGFGLPFVGLIRLGNELVLWSGFVFCFVSWVAAGVFLAMDASLSVIANRDN